MKIYTKKGEAYFGLGDYGRAIQDHDEAIRRDPMSALAFYNRGGAYIELGQRDLAIQDYRETIKLDHRFTVSYLHRCELIYDDMDRFQPATKDCKSLERLDSQYALAFAGSGSEFFELGQIKRAIRDFDEAIRLDASPEVYNKRGLAHQRLGDLDNALARSLMVASGKSILRQGRRRRAETRDGVIALPRI